MGMAERLFPPNNLKLFRERKGMSQQELAALVGTTKTSIYRIESGRQELSVKWQRKFAEKLNCTIEQLMNHSMQEPPAIHADYVSEPLRAPATFRIKVYDVSCSAGNGWINDDECVIDEHVYTRAWLKSITNAAPDELALIKVRGDSMHPTLRDGDLVLIDMTQINPAGGGMFVVEESGALMVKRMQLRDGKPWLISDNKSYGEYESQGVKIIGRVIESKRREA